MAEKLSLTELQLLIRDSLYLALPQMFWVIAEISEITLNSSGHCYLELIEKNQDENHIRARIRGIIWNSRYSFIRSFFENITGETLKTGLKILIKARVEYHEVYGLSLVINDIDPSFTLGEMEMKRQMIIKRLEQEGVLTMNREIDFPILPQRIAVVSSKNAAGYTDFINHLHGNSSGYVFYSALIETPMQGTETEQGVIDALDRIAANYHLFDLVVIIRGGGSQTDLSWFDSYNIAYHVTQFPLPVVTGIGHEKNMSVTDLVAYRSLKTPTAVADFLIDGMAAAENRLDDLSSEIRDNTNAIIEEYSSLIETFSIKLSPLTRMMISASREKLTGKAMDLTRIVHEKTYRSGVATATLVSRLLSSVRSFTAARKQATESLSRNLIANTTNLIHNNSARLASLGNALLILDPDNVLKRGYTITSMKGKILKSSNSLKPGDIIDTRFTDGTVSSGVMGGTERQ